MIKMLKIFRCKIIALIHGNIHIGKNSTFGRGTVLYAPNRMTIGNNVYIGKYCTLNADCIIKNNVLIGNNVGIIGKYDHNFKTIGKPIKDSEWIGDKDYSFKGKGKIITIEDDVWVGYGVIIMTGVTVGKGAIIGAGSVVTKDVEPYSIVVGNPAQKISNRFSKDEILRHEKILYGE